ncbi:MAG TPA: hypothetical protein VLG14_18585 [Sphingomonas sp.]|nr:hypothetical protein [Sphingomonas sp.]
MRYQLWTAAIVSAALFPAQPTAAQGFLKRLADRALTSAGEEKSDQPSTPPPAPRRTATPTAKSTPPYTSTLPKPADADAKRAAYNKFGEAPCNDCEGGIALDGTPKFTYDSQFSGLYNERAKRIGNWPVGYVHRWKGKASVGTLTVAAEEKVGDFRCRRAVYKLARGTSSIERPSLVCWGLANSSSSVENWHEIY